ncbi:unnamed protein product [Calicophoron daubneyi]|uniref:Uncharacterized protein n=1 Tax=Calicophoron daubneyi TaxID=300641 RepID=A0AAV2TN63_CALDB
MIRLVLAACFILIQWGQCSVTGRLEKCTLVVYTSQSCDFCDEFMERIFELAESPEVRHVNFRKVDCMFHPHECEEIWEVPHIRLFVGKLAKRNYEQPGYYDNTVPYFKKELKKYCKKRP